jgi:hypothetical protein
LGTVLAAMAAATAGWAVVKPLLGVDLTVATFTGTVTVDALAVTLGSLAGGYAAWVVLVLLTG